MFEDRDLRRIFGSKTNTTIKCSTYSRIPLFWYPWDWTGARLLNIPDYQRVPILTEVLTGNYREFAHVSYFHFIIKKTCFFNYHRPSHRFSSEPSDVNCLDNT
jgi:hypothetical protein